MADDSKKSETEESSAAEVSPVRETAGSAGGWGGWGFSLSYLSDLQKAAAEAAEEISRNVCVLRSETNSFFQTFSFMLYPPAFVLVTYVFFLLIFEMWIMVMIWLTLNR